MDSAEQAEGEKRVKRLLIDPLMKRGLAKPSTLTKAGFEDMVKDLCARLAYMSEDRLMSLEEECAGNAGGKDKDRFPIGNHILEWAAKHQSPENDASPLIRAVFSEQLGLDALAGGWAPELLGYLKKTRTWPKAFAVNLIRERSDGAIRQIRSIEDRIARHIDVPPSELEWHARRLAVVQKCQSLAKLGKRQGVEV